MERAMDANFLIEKALEEPELLEAAAKRSLADHNIYYDERAISFGAPVAEGESIKLLCVVNHSDNYPITFTMDDLMEIFIDEDRDLEW